MNLRSESGQLENQFFDILSGPGTIRFAFSERGVFGFSLTNPATTDSSRVNDRGQSDFERREYCFGVSWVRRALKTLT